MANPQPQNRVPPEQNQSQVVYRRGDLRAQGGSASTAEAFQSRAREIAPAITPLIIGFTLLLGLIMLQGYMSIRRTDDVSTRVLDLENQHTARLSLLLQLRLAVTKLNNEARVRHEANTRNELKPPFAVRLGNARDEVANLLAQLDKPPLPDDPSWRQFRNDLSSYLEVTYDLSRYST